MNIIATESQNKGLGLNSRKTEVMVISKKHCTTKCNFMVHETSMKQVNVFKYRCTLVTAGGRLLRKSNAEYPKQRIIPQTKEYSLLYTSLSIEVRGIEFLKVILSQSCCTR